jgi:phosphatidylglycerol:prolipoprotein diacylglycerol transferase
MVDPVIFTVKILGITFALRWYGVLIATALVFGVWFTSREVRRKGEDPEHVLDALLWVVPVGVIGARLWYVANDILGGDRYYLENPARIINIPSGGLHIYGAILLGGLAALLYARQHKVDFWLFLDSVAPGLLIGQAIARPANFINQELYGPPTDLPWGIAIDGANRLSPWDDLARYPEDTTRFHPTFAYEILWNLAAASLLIWLARRFEKMARPGVTFAAWLILAGTGRFIIEWFRPDQPRLAGTDISFTRIAAALMVLAGTLFILVKWEIVRAPFWSPGATSYAIASPEPVRAAPKNKRRKKRKGRKVGK